MTSSNEAVELLLSDRLLGDCWAIHHAFDRFGFPPEDVFVVRASNIAVLLMTQGSEFSVNVGVPANGPERFVEDWDIVVKAIRDGGVSESLLGKIWQRCPLSHDTPQTVAFIRALKGKGIKIWADPVTVKPPGQSN